MRVSVELYTSLLLNAITVIFDIFDIDACQWLHNLSNRKIKA